MVNPYTDSIAYRSNMHQIYMRIVFIAPLEKAKSSSAPPASLSALLLYDAGTFLLSLRCCDRQDIAILPVAYLDRNA